MVCRELLSQNSWKHPDEIASSVVFERFDERLDIKQLNARWFHQSQATRNCQYPDCFEAFTKLWRAFNGWAQWISQQKIDRYWIDALTLNARLQESFAQLLEHDHHFSTIAYLFREQWPIFRADEINNKGIPWFTGPRQEVVGYYLKSGVQSFAPQCWKEHRNRNEVAPLDWPHVLAVLYRVRNNLEHGVKAQNAGNHEIVTRAFQTLLYFLENCGFFD